jgi:hypothetical protein
MAFSYADKTPPINAAGKYVLRAPFVADPLISFKCEAISGFEALEERGVNVKTNYYDPFGSVVIDEYSGDRSRGINIITLMANNGTVIYVPSSFIISYPGEKSVPHGRLIVVVDCGPLPEDYIVDNLMNQLKQAAITYVGNDGVIVSAHFLPMKGFVDASTANNMKAGRLDKIANTATIFLKEIVGTEKLQKSESKVSALEELLKG